MNPISISVNNVNYVLQLVTNIGCQQCCYITVQPSMFEQFSKKWHNHVNKREPGKVVLLIHACYVNNVVIKVRFMLART